MRRAEISCLGEYEKPSPNWEGPYHDYKVVRLGAYRLCHLDGTPIPHLNA